VLCVARRMGGGDVQSVEIAILGLDFRPVEHRESHRDEEVFEFLLTCVIGCKEPWRRPGAGRGRADQPAAHRAPGPAASDLPGFASSAASISCLTELSSLPAALRSSGAILPISRLIWASEPLRPSTSTRTRSSSSLETALATPASAFAPSSDSLASSISQDCC